MLCVVENCPNWAVDKDDWEGECEKHQALSGFRKNEAVLSPLYTSGIVEIVEQKDQMTYSDFTGAIQAQVLMIMRKEKPSLLKKGIEKK